MTAIVDVRGWLEANGCRRFAELFEDNEIDGEALLELEEAHLEQLGIPLGPRLKLLRAIAQLREARVAAAQSLPTERARSETTPPREPRAEAERRQLTVMFVDLVGSTELSAQLDPEDMGRVIRAYQQCCAGVVERWGGHVAKYMGDGVLAYFGWPQAHEDEAERAVRAGLALIDALAGLETPAGEPLAARVGIATGLVMVGELIGEGAAREEAVVGETPNLAARLQTLAAPGSVVISQATRRLLGGLFELDDLGPQSLKGFAKPLAAWRVAGEGRAEGRFEARQSPVSRRWSGARRRSRCCCADGSRSKTARGRSSCCPASLASASRVWCGKCARASRTSPTYACSTNAPRTTRPVRCIR